MQFTAKMTQDLRNQARTNARIARSVRRRIASESEQYRQWCAAELDAERSPTTILAEGDSWYNYSIAGKDVIDNLEILLDLKINNLSEPGDEASEMLTGEQRVRLIDNLNKGPVEGKRRKYDVLLFSGGGNDLVGKKTFHKWINDHQAGMQAADYLNQTTIKRAFGMLAVHYEELLDIRDSYSPSTHLLINTYDFAIPDGRGVCFKGPWIKPGLDIRKVPKNLAFRSEIVKLFLMQFGKFLDNLFKNAAQVTVVPTQSTLAKEEWANELHPKKAGFRKVAKIFANEIEAAAKAAGR